MQGRKYDNAHLNTCVKCNTKGCMLQGTIQRLCSFVEVLFREVAALPWRPGGKAISCLFRNWSSPRCNQLSRFLNVTKWQASSCSRYGCSLHSRSANTCEANLICCVLAGMKAAIGAAAADTSAAGGRTRAQGRDNLAWCSTWLVVDIISALYMCITALQ